MTEMCAVCEHDAHGRGCEHCSCDYGTDWQGTITPAPKPSEADALAKDSNVTRDGMTVIIAGRYDAPDLHLTGGINWEIALDPSGGKDPDAIVYVNCRDLLDAVIMASEDTGDTYVAERDLGQRAKGAREAADRIMRLIAKDAWPEDPSPLEEQGYEAGLDEGFTVALRQHLCGDCKINIRAAHRERIGGGT